MGHVAIVAVFSPLKGMLLPFLFFTDVVFVLLCRLALAFVCLAVYLHTPFLIQCFGTGSEGDLGNLCCAWGAELSINVGKQT